MRQHERPLLGTLTDQLRQQEVFDRDRKQPETRALALLLHHTGLSCRKTSRLPTLLAEPVTHAPISTWYRRAAHLFREQPVQRHERLVIDETTLHIEQPRSAWPEDCDKDAGNHLTELFLWAAIDPDTQQLVHVAVSQGRSGVEREGFDAGNHLTELFLWAAIDPDTQQLVHVAVSQGRSGVEALAFVKHVLARCDNQPAVHVDRGVWYPWPLEVLGLDWQVTSGGVRNTVET